MIQAAQELLPKVGCSGLNLRDVARKARVNLGMFHYHFGSKDEFTRAVLQQTYELFFKEFNLAVEQENENPRRALEAALFAFARFVRDNRQLIVALLRDVLNGNKIVLQFVQENIGRHVGVILDLIQKAHPELRFTTQAALVFLLSTVNVPILVTELVRLTGSKRVFGLTSSEFSEIIASDEALRNRIGLAVDGLTGERILA